jgi:hypothetical protein
MGARWGLGKAWVSNEVCRGSAAELDIPPVEGRVGLNFAGANFKCPGRGFAEDN